jgi:hypothetical protein
MRMVGYSTRGIMEQWDGKNVSRRLHYCSGVDHQFVIINSERRSGGGQRIAELHYSPPTLTDK